MHDFILLFLFLNISFITFNLHRKRYLGIKINAYDLFIWSFTLLVIVFSIKPLHPFVYVFIASLHILYYKDNYKNIHIRSSLARSQNVIFDAIHELPYGILVYEKDKDVHLMNNIMIELGAAIQGGLFNDPHSLWTQLLKHENLIEPSLLDEEGMKLIRLDDKVWRFYKKEHDETYVEIYALDTTLLYETLIQIEKDTLALNKQRQSLKILLKDLFETHKQEEVLNYKIKIHNTMGEAILQSRKVLEEKGSQITQLARWNHLLKSLRNSFSDQIDTTHHQALQDLIQAGKDIGTHLHIKGHFPYDKTYARAFYEIIREAMINAKKHGDAKNVYVNIESPDHTTQMMIYNDGKLFEETFKLKGGLKQIQEEVEKNWGTIDFYPNENFTILIRYPY